MTIAKLSDHPADAAFIDNRLDTNLIDTGKRPGFTEKRIGVRSRFERSRAGTPKCTAGIRSDLAGTGVKKGRIAYSCS